MFLMGAGTEAINSVRPVWSGGCTAVVRSTAPATGITRQGHLFAIGGDLVDDVQRLDGRGTLAMAVQQVVQGVLGDALPQEKRVREGRVSSNTGGLSRARQRLPLM